MALTWNSRRDDDEKERDVLTWDNRAEKLERQKQAVELEKRKQQAISDIQKQKEEKTQQPSSIFQRAKDAVVGIFKKDGVKNYTEATKKNVEEFTQRSKVDSETVDWLVGKTAKEADQKKRGLVSGNKIIPVKQQEPRYISDSYYLEKKKLDLERGGLTADEKLFGDPLQTFTGRGVTQQPIGKVAKDVEAARQEKFQTGSSEELTEITLMLEDENYKPKKREQLADAFKLEEQTERGVASYTVGLGGTASNVVDMASWVYENAGGDAENLRSISENLDKTLKAITPEEQSFLEEMLTGAGSMSGFYMLGLGTSTTVAGLGKVNAISAWIAGKAVEWGLEGLMESASVYEEQRKKGESVRDSNERAVGVLAGNIVLNSVLGFLNVKAKTLPYFSQILKYPVAGAREGTQEIVQQFLSNIATDKPPAEGLRKSGSIGFWLGMITGGADIDMTEDTQITEQDVYDIEEAVKAEVENIPDDELTITPERKQEILDNLPEEIRGDLENWKGEEKVVEGKKLAQSPETEIEATPEAIAKAIGEVQVTRETEQVETVQQEEAVMPQAEVKVVEGKPTPTKEVTPVRVEKKAVGGGQVATVVAEAKPVAEVEKAVVEEVKSSAISKVEEMFDKKLETRLAVGVVDGQLRFSGESVGGVKKTIAKKKATAIRLLTNNLTEIQKSNISKKLATNYVGKRISANGKETVIIGHSFGKPRFVIDGKTVSLKESDTLKSLDTLDSLRKQEFVKFLSSETKFTKTEAEEIWNEAQKPIAKKPAIQEKAGTVISKDYKAETVEKVVSQKKKAEIVTAEKRERIQSEEIKVLDKYLGAGEKKYKETFNNIMNELETAQAGYRLSFETTGQGQTREQVGVKSSFPSWVPEGDMRSKATFDAVLADMEDLVIKYPTGTKSKQRFLYDLILDQLDNRMGVDTKAERGKIFDEYGETKGEAIKKAGTVTEVVPATNEELGIPTPKGVRRQITPEIAQQAETKAIEGTTGKKKLAKKAKKLLKLMPEAEIDVSDTEFNSVVKEQDRANAAAFTAEHPDRAVKISRGLESPPPGVSRTSIQLATIAEARSREDNKAVADLSTAYLQKGTRLGQELALRESFDVNSEMFWMQDLYRERLNTVAKKQGWVYAKNTKKKFTKQQTAQEATDSSVQKASSKINKEAQSKLQSAQSIIDKLTCKT